MRALRVLARRTAPLLALWLAGAACSGDEETHSLPHSNMEPQAPPTAPPTWLAEAGRCLPGGIPRAWETVPSLPAALSPCSRNWSVTVGPLAYDSRLAADPQTPDVGFGKGWSLADPAHTRLFLAQADASVVVIVAAGRRATRFVRGANDTWTSPEPYMERARLRKNGDDWILSVERVEHRFDARGRLSDVTDEDGPALTCTWDAEDHLTRVALPGGLTTEYRWSAEAPRHLESIRDYQGYEVRFSYAGTNLIGVAFPGKPPRQTTLSYRSGALLSAVTPPAMPPTVYDFADDGSFRSVTDPRGETLQARWRDRGVTLFDRFAYPLADVTFERDRDALASFTNGRGTVSTFVRDAQLQLTSTTEQPKGHKPRTKTFEPNDSQRGDAHGISTVRSTIGFDDQGKPIVRTDRFRFLPDGRLDWKDDGLERTTYTYFTAPADAPGARWADGAIGTVKVEYHTATWSETFDASRTRLRENFYDRWGIGAAGGKPPAELDRAVWAHYHHDPGLDVTFRLSPDGKRVLWELPQFGPTTEHRYDEHGMPLSSSLYNWSLSQSLSATRKFEGSLQEKNRIAGRTTSYGRPGQIARDSADHVGSIEFGFEDGSPEISETREYDPQFTRPIRTTTVQRRHPSGVIEATRSLERFGNFRRTRSYRWFPPDGAGQEAAHDVPVVVEFDKEFEQGMAHRVYKRWWLQPRVEPGGSP